MMNNELLFLISGFLIVVVTLNLWMTFRLIYTMKNTPLDVSSPQNLSIGSITPGFSAKKLTDSSSVLSHEYRDYAKVWIFLSTACDKCKGKIPELENILSATDDAGVIMRILTDESKRRMKGFLRSPILQGIALIIDKMSYTLINPQGASPYYMFIDNQNILQAEGMIGDENWLGFIEQLTELKQVKE